MGVRGARGAAVSARLAGPAGSAGRFTAGRGGHYRVGGIRPWIPRPRLRQRSRRAAALDTGMGAVVAG